MHANRYKCLAFKVKTCKNCTENIRRHSRKISSPGRRGTRDSCAPGIKFKTYGMKSRNKKDLLGRGHWIRMAHNLCNSWRQDEGSEWFHFIYILCLLFTTEYIHCVCRFRIWHLSHYMPLIKICNVQIIEIWEHLISGGRMYVSLAVIYKSFSSAASNQVQKILKGVFTKYSICQVYDGCSDLRKNSWFQLFQKFWYHIRNDLIGYIAKVASS